MCVYFYKEKKEIYNKTRIDKGYELLTTFYYYLKTN